MWYRTWIDSDSNRKLNGADDPFADFTWPPGEGAPSAGAPVPLPELAAGVT
jgi:hypothetical protein